MVNRNNNEQLGCVGEAAVGLVDRMWEVRLEDLRLWGEVSGVSFWSNAGSWS